MNAVAERLETIFVTVMLYAVRRQRPVRGAREVGAVFSNPEMSLKREDIKPVF